ncbi:MAG: ADOP family duplicated permease [Gemmatimonadetes bacterium]|nr:ADOP family duplicated permease [Gemmatimonadota bacterium]
MRTVGGWFDELRDAGRALLRRPLYSILATLILALGLAASLAVFTYFNGFYQPFPGVDPKGLVQAFDGSDENPYGIFSYLDYLDYAKEATAGFSSMAAVSNGYAASVWHEESTEVAFLEAVSGSYFPTLDVEMSVGRGLGPGDDIPGADPAAVISYAWFQRQWHGDPSVVGSIVLFNSRPYTVVGVAAPSFRGSLSDIQPDAWLPFAPFATRYTSWATASEQREAPLVRILGRLRDGVDRRQAAAELSRVAAGLDEIVPRESTRPRRPSLAPATWIDPATRVQESDTVRMMMAAAAGFLLLVCANVGNLLLAMSAGRRREMALRAALGAPRGRLLRQVLLESLVLATAAGGVALALAAPMALRLGSYFARPSVWGENAARQMTLDARVVWVALGVSVVTAALAGLFPALAASRRDVAATLKTGSADAEGPPARMGSWRLPGTRDLMVSAQVAFSVVLLVVAGLTLRTLSKVGQIDPGFDYRPMIGGYISTSSTSVTEAERDLWFRTLAERLTEEPWVRSATISDQAPLTGHGSLDFQSDDVVDPVRTVISSGIPGYFHTLGMHVLRGREFTASDSLEAPDVAILNEAAVRRFFPGSDGVGRQIRQSSPDGPGRVYEVVGVVNDARIQNYLAAPEPVVYFTNRQQHYATGRAIAVSVTIGPKAAVPRLYQWLRAFEPHVAIVNLVAYTDVVRGHAYVQRMNAQMFSALAILGLILAAVGIFSVTSLAVTQRSQEIGVRMAIGAQRGDIGRLVLRRIFSTVALGLGVGLAASYALAGLARSLLFGVGATDPVSITSAALVLLVAALVAGLVPAQRAAAVDPIRSLKAE